MGNIKEAIKNKLGEFMKQDDEIGRSTLRMFLAGILSKEKEKRYKISKLEPGLAKQELQKKSELGDEEIVDVVCSEIKKRKDAAAMFRVGNRPELAEKEEKEIGILQKYLPEQISEDELKKIVKSAIEKIRAEEIHPVKYAKGGVPLKAEQFNRVKDMGKVMAEIMPKIKGKADVGSVSKIVKELLSIL
ncbi:MAG: hypothetical protein A3F95_01890 [Candidatus Nealsonbacteria bacterium RIFCSPLOWO2_12_FULL_39_31]|uniref:Asn/Gln amidotransferase domain-containing protein n=3 Tax=Candidatus Nealsoniibacteriota TaxID=1817911 RepID=A0A1G2EK40_9BACT|nr:MAG: hypothetical protein A2626_00480 [Candidatus Nealsonbacteria bacterium RIFCSPHIGHO2_01_FULL_38_55]OGZ20984.1 MAG: hypothetical protein A2W55_02670 [Candidatus Nealsonbacteria bacterium RIFCSPHIGHO2_02_38_10]OGZ21035.1 MAG: hypothetical protein A3C48_00615 [Candidatus Nealsonbacteria bacterium RIFCSPHIGHO2_02_FULL_38_75]OGZ22542.1 MAG: hypothetical protein A2981_02735 [Candidatus Nealsonbacteria bacterium RIFCSPLOWO2_01_FULL_38_120]OGZ23506.1 MAG: hypothetical protein A3E18_01405 [Candid